MKKTILILAMVVSLTACTDSNRATHALHQAGYTDIKIGGYSWFGCSEDDTFKNKFSAKGPTGVPVSGSVCMGFFKGSTIRLD